MLARFEHMKKHFGNTKAVNDVSVKIEQGEIRAIVGENGSGKSTLLSMIAGILQPDGGEMYLEEKTYAPRSQTDANRLGVSMIVQEICTLSGLTVAENLFLGREEQYTKFGIRNKKRLNRMAGELLSLANLSEIDPAIDIETCSLEQRKLIELIRAIDISPRLLMVDETTTALSQTGREALYQMMRGVKEKNGSVLFISHDLKEILSVCDTITVMRDGVLIDTVNAVGMSEERLKQLMVGRELSGHYYREDYGETISDEKVLEIKNLSCPGHFQDVSFSLHRGEILGLGGLSEAGMHEIARAIYGMEYDVTGKVIAGGKVLRTVQDRLNAGVGYISKNRDTESLFNHASICDNICITCYSKIAPHYIVTAAKRRSFAKKQAELLQIKMRDITQDVGTLSGGNKQKTALCKWLACDTDIFILDSPTRGIDVGVKAVIYGLMEELKKNGKSIVIVSEELLELIGMSDRILIFKDGTISGEIERRRDLSENDLVQAMI